MTLDMINGVKGLVFNEGQRLCCHYAHEKASAKARTVGHGNSINVIPGVAGAYACEAASGGLFPAQGLIYYRQDRLHMRPSRHLWYYATVFGVYVA